MKLTTKTLKRMVKEELAKVEEVFGRPEIVTAMLSRMNCEGLQEYKHILSDPKFGKPTPAHAPIWEMIEAEIVKKCSDQRVAESNAPDKEGKINTRGKS